MLLPVVDKERTWEKLRHLTRHDRAIKVAYVEDIGKGRNEK